MEEVSDANHSESGIADLEDEDEEIPNYCGTKDQDGKYHGRGTLVYVFVLFWIRNHKNSGTVDHLFRSSHLQHLVGGNQISYKNTHHISIIFTHNHKYCLIIFQRSSIFS